MERKLFVAIHVLHGAQAARELTKALGAGADGVFLVNNGLHVSGEDLFLIAKHLRSKAPRGYIGLNPLGMEPLRAIEHATNFRGCIDALWLDDGGIRETAEEAFLPVDYQRALAELRRERIAFFGSIAMKYQPQPVNLSRVAALAAATFDIVVTSGDRTGSPPSLQKVQTIMRAIAESNRSIPIALASGITAENIQRFARYTAYFIVGTAFMDTDEYSYDPERIQLLKEKMA